MQPKATPLTFDPWRWEQAKLVVSFASRAAAEQISLHFSSCGAEVMHFLLSPSPFVCTHQGSCGAGLIACVLWAKLSRCLSRQQPAMCFVVVTPSGKHLVVETLLPDSPDYIWW